MRMKIDHLLLMRLLRVGSPGLPIGAFSYSKELNGLSTKDMLAMKLNLRIG